VTRAFSGTTRYCGFVFMNIRRRVREFSDQCAALDSAVDAMASRIRESKFVAQALDRELRSRARRRFIDAVVARTGPLDGRPQSLSCTPPVRKAGSFLLDDYMLHVYHVITT
jgi:hypothetical protein